MTELHLHIDGSIRPETGLEIAREMGIVSMDETIESFRDRLSAPEHCGSLNEYLDRFAIPLQLVQERSVLVRITRELAMDLYSEGTHTAELRFAPHSSIGMGMDQRDACEAVLEGLRQGMERCPGFDGRVILCCMRGIDSTANLETVRLAREMRGTRITGVDLAGAEALFPTCEYMDVFAEAKRLDVPYTIHAGEADGPESIRAALAMGTKRIGHGVRAVEDPALVKRLVDEGITLEVCPTSNVQTAICDSYETHPIRRLFDAGVRVTISSDNRTVSGTTQKKEIEIVRRCLGFTDEEIDLMEKYAREALL